MMLGEEWARCKSKRRKKWANFWRSKKRKMIKMSSSQKKTIMLKRKWNLKTYHRMCRRKRILTKWSHNDLRLNKIRYLFDSIINQEITCLFHKSWRQDRCRTWSSRQMIFTLHSSYFHWTARCSSSRTS